MGESVDPAFVQDEEHRPGLRRVGADGIPLIDLSDQNERLVSQIRGACREWGFFQVTNHGVPSEARRKIEAASRDFFDAPLPEKKKVRRDEFHPMGYHDAEHTKNVRDWKQVFDFLLHDPTTIPASHEPEDQALRTITNQWPQYPPGFREACEEYAKEVEKLAFRLLGLISLSLGLPADRLDAYFKHQTTFLRLNYYPPCPAPHLALGVGRHKDSGALTVLAQDDVGGLEVKRKSDGAWIQVKPVADAFIINVGDVIQVWSNEAYESAEHRVVVNTEKERFSIPFFFNPAHYVAVKPLEEVVTEQSPSRYREYKWGKFFANRNRSDFKKRQVDNLQIQHFRIQL